ncbi:hypothetical protein KC19_2G032100 [Ceratodon purpureus]|uniref:Uncharacterized protein n=1 Tax=Ceratodon purpureus TaxID=3225 RepID=A0A8T0ITL3_CERPU|nr:hypothetical protein KC19_2G032100 [Ceratodon purpureus]
MVSVWFRACVNNARYSSINSEWGRQRFLRRILWQNLAAKLATERLSGSFGSTVFSIVGCLQTHSTLFQKWMHSSVGPLQRCFWVLYRRRDVLYTLSDSYDSVW